jgi:hypothetical protein
VGPIATCVTVNILLQHVDGTLQHMYETFETFTKHQKKLEDMSVAIANIQIKRLQHMKNT